MQPVNFIEYGFFDSYWQKLNFDEWIMMRNPSISGNFWWPYSHYILYSELQIVISGISIWDCKVLKKWCWTSCCQHVESLWHHTCQIGKSESKAEDTVDYKNGRHCQVSSTQEQPILLHRTMVTRRMAMETIRCLMTVKDHDQEPAQLGRSHSWCDWSIDPVSVDKDFLHWWHSLHPLMTSNNDS